MPESSGPQLGFSLPPGYCLCQGPDGLSYIVPNYLVPATEVAEQIEQFKSALNVYSAPGGPLSMDDMIHDLVSPAAIRAPPIPSLTQRELLAAHAEIKALQIKYGLSYKDAAHRLYHAEVQKLMVADEALRSISDIRQQIDSQIMDDINERIFAIDEQVNNTHKT